MDETKIQEQLAAKLHATQTVPHDDPGRIVEAEPVVQPPVEATHNNLPLDNMVLKQQVMDLLNVPTGSRNSTDTQDQIDQIVRWAADSAPSKDLADILDAIARQERIMGIQFKEDRIQRLYRYVKLNRGRQAIETQMRALYG